MLYNAIQWKEYPYHITVDDWLDVDRERKRFFENIPVLNDFLKDHEKNILTTWIKAQ